MEYKVLNEEAWASIMHLYVTFEVDGQIYQATATYYNGSDTDDCVVSHYYTGETPNDTICAIGQGLIDTLEVEKHLTC